MFHWLSKVLAIKKCTLIINIRYLNGNIFPLYSGIDPYLRLFLFPSQSKPMIILTGFQNQVKLESGLMIIWCSKDNRLNGMREFKFYQELQKEILAAHPILKIKIAGGGKVMLKFKITACRFLYRI